MVKKTSIENFHATSLFMLIMFHSQIFTQKWCKCHFVIFVSGTKITQTYLVCEINITIDCKRWRKHFFERVWMFLAVFWEKRWKTDILLHFYFEVASEYTRRASHMPVSYMIKYQWQTDSLALTWHAVRRKSSLSLTSLLCVLCSFDSRQVAVYCLSKWSFDHMQ